MSRKIQLTLSFQTWERLEALLEEANRDFVEGRVFFSDIVEFAIEKASFDVTELRRRKANPRRSLLRHLDSDGPLDFKAIMNVVKQLEATQKEVEARRVRNPQRENTDV